MVCSRKNFCRFVMGKAVVKEGSSIRIMFCTVTFHDNGDQFHAVSFCISHQRVQGFGSKACFATNGIFVIIQRIFVQHLMLSVKIAYFCLFIGRRNLIICFAHHGTVFLMLQQFFCNESHIAGCRIMIFVMETIGIEEVGIFTAQFFCPLCHVFGKGFRGAVHVFRYTIGGFIGRTQDDGPQHLFQSQGFAFLNGDMGTAGFDGIDRIMRECDFIRQFAMLQGQ